jgi:hypothetical protein
MEDDNILRVVFVGDTGERGAQAFIEALGPFLEATTEAEPLHAILDATQAGKLSAKARKIFFGLNRDSRVGKVAVIGTRRYLQVLGSFILKATRRDNIRFFDSEEQAIVWLKVRR